MFVQCSIFKKALEQFCFVYLCCKALQPLSKTIYQIILIYLLSLHCSIVLFLARILQGVESARYSPSCTVRFLDLAITPKSTPTLLPDPPGRQNNPCLSSTQPFLISSHSTFLQNNRLLDTHFRLVFLTFYTVRFFSILFVFYCSFFNVRFLLFVFSILLTSPPHNLLLHFPTPFCLFFKHTPTAAELITPLQNFLPIYRTLTFIPFCVIIVVSGRCFVVLLNPLLQPLLVQH